jgi:predicted RNase H-like HicB family nuclease
MDTWRVTAFWDEEAKVWVAESDEVPGLATEAPTLEGLVEKLKVMIPELLDLNGVVYEGDEVQFEVASRITATAPRRAP